MPPQHLHQSCGGRCIFDIESPAYQCVLCLQEEKRKEKEMKRITAKVEPEMLAKAMLRGEDDAIRTTDLPERQQLQPSQDPRDWRDPNSSVLAECAQ